MTAVTAGGQRAPSPHTLGPSPPAREAELLHPSRLLGDEGGQEQHEVQSPSGISSWLCKCPFMYLSLSIQLEETSRPGLARPPHYTRTRVRETAPKDSYKHPLSLTHVDV